MFTGRRRTPPVTIWKKTMIAISANSSPYSRMCRVTYSPRPVRGALSVRSTTLSSYSLTISDMIAS